MSMLKPDLREDEAIVLGAISGVGAVIQYQNYKLPIVNENEIYSIVFYGALAVIGYFYDNIIGDIILGYGVGGLLAVVV